MIRLDVGGHPWVGSAGFDVTRRAIVLGILVLAMLIPLMMIGDMVAERAGRRYQVEAEIAGLWGGSQAVAGPVLAVPYVTRTESTLSGGTVMQSEVRHLVYFLPETLDIRADLNAELRYRSTYEALVYAADVTMSGRFAAPDFSAWGVPPGDILWSEVTLFVGLTDLRGIRSVEFTLDDRPVAFAPGLAKTQLFRAGLQARLTNASGSLAGRSHSFTLRLAMNGSGAFEFLPLGSETTLAMSADWPHPSFTGTALPLEREIRGDGFAAAWAMSYLARAYPPAWRADDLAFADLPDGRTGVALVLPGDSYQQTDRIAKYGLLVIRADLRHHFRRRPAEDGAGASGAVPAGRQLDLHLLPAGAVAVGAPALRRRLCDRQRRRYRHGRALRLAHRVAIRRLCRRRRPRPGARLDVPAVADGGLRARRRQPGPVRGAGHGHVRDAQHRLVPRRPADRGGRRGG
jgi:inner membrane protein involved in colicin E2 resistance